MNSLITGFKTCFFNQNRGKFFLMDRIGEPRRPVGPHNAPWTETIHVRAEKLAAIVIVGPPRGTGYERAFADFSHYIR
ncbi:hypothetical protein D3C86_2175100 [compost metagenome]